MNNYISYIIGVIILFSACDSKNDEFEVKQYEHKISKSIIQLLSIGNSYSEDALAYVPFIMQNMGIETDIQLGILVQSSSSLEMHVDNFENAAAEYTFYLYDGGSSWKNCGNKTIQWVLDNYDWDVVTLQQSSQTSHTWSTYQPWCNKLIDDVRRYVEYPIMFVWYQTQIRPAQSNKGINWSDETITNHYVETVKNSKRIMKVTACEGVIPVATAIQNARSIDKIKKLGDYVNNPYNISKYGYLTAYDGVHLQEGLSCQIAAYTFVLSLLKLYGLEQYSIIGETTRVTSEWAVGKSIPGPHGSYIGSTEENCLIAQKCAVMAMKCPFEVTDMNTIINQEK